MIHQFIFAYPRPGMNEQDFQDYWVKVHAVQYASKIPQIRKYLVDTRIALPGENDNPLWCGVAEIWLKNEKEQLESLQSKEFLQGARLDEPNWAAFWRTVVLDTTTDDVLLPGPGEVRNSDMVKLLILSKRKAGLPLADFRSSRFGTLGTHTAKVLELPGLHRYSQSHTRDSFYAVGEAIFDCVESLWFDNVEAAVTTRNSIQQGKADYHLFAEKRYTHTMLVQEHWIIGPEPRPYEDPSAAPFSEEEGD